MEKTIQFLEQFLSDEKELLQDLAHDVAAAETDYEYSKTKALYTAQQARVGGIEDTIQALLAELGKRSVKP